MCDGYFLFLRQSNHLRWMNRPLIKKKMVWDYSSLVSIWQMFHFRRKGRCFRPWKYLHLYYTVIIVFFVVPFSHPLKVQSCITLSPLFSGLFCCYKPFFISYQIVSLPKLIDFDWRVDVKTSSNAISRMSMPTCIMQLQVSHRNTRFDASATSKLWNVSSILVLQGWRFNKIQSSCWSVFYRLDCQN